MERPAPNSMRVLLAEHNAIFRAMMCELLEGWGYEVVAVPDGDQACALLEAEDGPRLAVVEWGANGIDGVELCRRVRAARRTHYVYILLLTARAQSQDVVMGIQAGADDYVTKPFDADELCARLWAGRRILDLQEQLVQAHEALREQATRDSLTGLWNRGMILEILDREIARAKRQGEPVSFVMADVDYFKQINDACGHLAGDAVLKEVAERLRRNVRQYDAVGRYGGEEFLIVLPGCDLAGGMQQAERLRLAIANELFLLPGTGRAVTCSLGVAAADGTGPVDGDMLMREADSALYCAKRNGRNRTEGFGPELIEASVSETLLSSSTHDV